MKNQLKGHYCSDALDVHVASKTALQEVTYTDIQKRSKQMYKCWEKCIDAKG
jgi:transcription elongation factor GreA-like protein